MRKKFIGGNWKMNGDAVSAKHLVESLRVGLSSVESDVVVFPPFVYLTQVIDQLRDSRIKVGAQNQCEQAEGAFTGEVSAAMLNDIGCQYVVLGHSERRHIYGETDAQIAEKFVLAQDNHLVPVLCVGETLDEHEAGDTEKVVLKQLDAVITRSGISKFDQCVLAYEPVWAIGTGKTATPEQAQAVHSILREHLSKQDAKIADSLRIIYGGSVKAANARAIFAQPDVDGGLIGGASLKADEFIAICDV
ncbi:MAG: triose-phosphate isomerase [Legionellaceae bacterium]|nr:triose-phosphate isomerase [Legionellaceae bacterium]